MAEKRGSNRPKVIIGYVRVSTEGQGQNGISLDMQRDAIHAFADQLGVPLLAIFQDIASGVGAKSFPSRLELHSALEAVRDHDGTLAVWDWSRLSRHADDIAEIRAKLPDDDRIISLNDETHLEDAIKAGRLRHTQSSGEEISRRTREGMAKQKADGHAFGNPDILSVQRRGAHAISAKSDTLVKTIGDILRSIPDHEKLSRTQVADILNDRGIVTGAGLPWNVSRVTGPLRKARALLNAERSAEADAAMRAHPDFGRF